VHTLIAFFSKLFDNNKTINLQSRRSRWKWYLAIIGLIIVLFSTIYTNYLVGQLREQEEKRMELYSRGQEIMGGVDAETYNTTMPQIIRDLVEKIAVFDSSIPMILTDEHYEIIDARNFWRLDSTVATPADTAYIKGILDQLILEKRQPVLVKDDMGMIISKIYFDDSHVLTLLKYYPILQFILISLFIGFGYLGFSASRRNEQNRVWVGMAKETAHQLGTPIAAILGWIEHLRSSHEDDEMTQEVVNELQHDVDRLTLVADRFSKIGSEPELSPTNMYEAIERCRIYMQKRAPRKVVFDFPELSTPPPDGIGTGQYSGVKMNNHLFDWVVENLLRNAIDALENGKGTLKARIYEEEKWVCVDISDTGQGIPSNKFRAVFQPGFTTKKRGWGLGLSLAKRIIDNYHGGKIFVKESIVGKGTTFTIKLPKSK
jgi:Histidine kinase-, DNA gyrase B-, and HSP90-like ATPase